MVQPILYLMFSICLSIKQLVMAVQSIGSSVVFLQIVRIFVSYKIAVSVIQLCPLVITGIASLIIEYQTMFIINWIHKV